MMAKHSAAHPGFKAEEAKIGKEKGIRNPGAVLAAASRKASPEAKKENPRLKNVGGGRKTTSEGREIEKRLAKDDRRY
jgi:hypothetical protein